MATKAEDLSLSYDGQLLDAATEPIKIRISSAEKTVRLQLIVDPKATVVLHYSMWQASGVLGVQLEDGEISFPARTDGSRAREIDLPVPFVNSEKELQFRAVFEANARTDAKTIRLAMVDVHRRGLGELPQAIRRIEESGVTLLAESETVRKILNKYQIAYESEATAAKIRPEYALIVDEITPNTGPIKIPESGHALYFINGKNRATITVSEKKVSLDDAPPFQDSRESAELFVLQTIQNRIQQMPNPKDTP